jgi:predicted transporter
MSKETTPRYPSTASTLSLVGGILIILCGVIIIAFSVFILPNLSYANLTRPPGVTDLPGLVSGFVRLVGVFELISGIIVLASAVMMQMDPVRWRTWGVLILVFSVLSFFGLGGFVAGAVLGIVGGIKALTWKPPTQ